ncbi:MAG: ABC transporter substrate-binding protein [Anaerolineae bacterium]|nr:ABC transporter substrate-binding protein [Anaerolineae bacterium]
MYRKLFVLCALLGLFSLPLVKVLAQTPTTPEQSERVWSNSISYDTLIDAIPSDPDTLDPAWNYENIGDHIIQQIYDPLITLNREKTDEFIPVLATGWTISPDGQTYTFDIRSGVIFHNGNDLTPEDVAYTFQRNLLQGGTWSPQWLFTEPLFGTGIYDVAELVDPTGALDDNPEALQAADPELLMAACINVTNAIVANEISGTVTFHLAQPWSPLLSTLVGSWGSVIDKEWAIAQGTWDGDCATWQDYYGVTSENTPLRTVANGTGPFMLDRWTSGEEVVLTRNSYYWRQTPMWSGGPSGPAALEQVIITNVYTATTRADMLLSGDADLASVYSADWDRLDEHVLLSYDQPDGLVASRQSPTGTLRLYTGGLAPSATDAFFVYDISSDGPRNYIGSGTLDGNGIPSDFFNDIHVRKAFNYAFDWDQYIAEVFDGEAIQRRGPIIKGVLGYTDTQTTYFHNPTLALQEFNQAWGGQVATVGFSLTLSYNQGNATRQAVAEILKAGIEALDPKFHVNVVEMEWPDYLDDTRYSRTPIIISGWMQDIPHPHNWVQPYLIGTYAFRQRLPDDQQTIYQTKTNTCLQLVGDAARICYEDIQNTTYLSATDIFLAQGMERRYVRAEVRGYYTNMAMGSYYYALSKGPVPTVETIIPEVEQSVSFSSTLGTTTTISLPAGSVAQATDLVVTPDIPTYGTPTGFRLGDLSFEIEAFNADSGSLILEPHLNNPITITLHYNAEATGVLTEDTLRLFWWNGSDWEDAACGAYVRDVTNDMLHVPICHFSKFALGGTSYNIYLPIVIRSAV